MKKHYIEIRDEWGKSKWAFVFAYDIGWRNLDEIGDWLEALGSPDWEILEAQDLLMEWNKAFTKSKSRIRMSVVCIGKATDDAQWWDSLDHEIDHLQHDIMRYYDVESGSERAAYLQGYIMRKIIQVLKQDGYTWHR